MAPIDMATLKCLACGHDNKVGDESCTSCSSSLNLKLCSACEAINANSAERCHSCGAQFVAQAEVAAPPEVQVLSADEAVPRAKSLPAAWVRAAERITWRSTRRRAALWSLPLAAAAGLAGYYFYGMPEAIPQEKVLKQAPAMTPSPSAAEAAATSPKAAPTALTQTATTARAAAVAPAPAASVVLPASVPAASPRRPVAVTHTRPAAAAAGVVAEAPAVAVPPQTKPKDESSACAPAVVALGLCRAQ